MRTPPLPFSFSFSVATIRVSWQQQQFSALSHSEEGIWIPVEVLGSESGGDYSAGRRQIAVVIPDDDNSSK